MISILSGFKPACFPQKIILHVGDKKHYLPFCVVPVLVGHITMHWIILWQSTSGGGEDWFMAGNGHYFFNFIISVISSCDPGFPLLPYTDNKLQLRGISTTLQSYKPMMKPTWVWLCGNIHAMCISTTNGLKWVKTYTWKDSVLELVKLFMSQS